MHYSQRICKKLSVQYHTNITKLADVTFNLGCFPKCYSLSYKPCMVAGAVLEKITVHSYKRITYNKGNLAWQVDYKYKIICPVSPPQRLAD